MSALGMVLLKFIVLFRYKLEQQNLLRAKRHVRVLNHTALVILDVVDLLQPHKLCLNLVKLLLLTS